jgi:hypothetical protein
MIRDMKRDITAVFFVFGMADIVIGGIGILFCFFSGFLSEGFRFLPLFGSEFWAFLGLPLLILACGILIVAKAGNRGVFSAFISLIAVIYLAATFFSTNPPVIVEATKIPSFLLGAFKLFLPGAGIIFFLLQGVVSFFNRKPSPGSGQTGT